MFFKTFIESVAKTKDLPRDILSKLQQDMNGIWKFLKSSKKLLPPYFCVSYTVFRIIGHSIVMDGDEFIAHISVFILKKPREELKGIDSYNLDKTKWLNDPVHWHSSITYDDIKGSNLVEIRVSLYGKKSGYLADDPDKDIVFFGKPSFTGMEDIADNYTSNPFHTPKQVSDFIYEAIKKYYGEDGGDNSSHNPRTPSGGQNKTYDLRSKIMSV